jgi:hypothetical protein
VTVNQLIMLLTECSNEGLGDTEVLIGESTSNEVRILECVATENCVVNEWVVAKKPDGEETVVLW